MMGAEAKSKSRSNAKQQRTLEAHAEFHFAPGSAGCASGHGGHGGDAPTVASHLPLGRDGVGLGQS